MERPVKKQRANESARHENTASAQDPPRYDAEVLQRQFVIFLANGDVDSAQIIGELLVSIALFSSELEVHHNNGNILADSRKKRTFEIATSDAKRLSPAFHAKTLRLFADLMLVKREYKRAIRYYRLSCRNIKVLTKEVELEVKLKVAKCYVELQCIIEAIQMLISTPFEDRSLSMNLLLGKLYMSEGLSDKAEESYMAALRQNPYALEAALALTKLATANDAAPESDETKESGQSATVAPVAIHRYNVARFYSDIASGKIKDTGLSNYDLSWIQTLVVAHMDAERGKHKAAIESFITLIQVFPGNLHCLLHKGGLELNQELLHQANITFRRARQVDDLNLTYMDRFANCLRKGNLRTNLNDLVQELFKINSTCAESWLAAAYYSDVKGDYEVALQFSKRAIQEQPRSAPAHLLRGEVLLRLHRPQPALTAFWTACRLTPSMEAYTGIITSYCNLYALGVNRFKEALATAKSVVKLFPLKAQSFVLFGSVLALSSEHREQAHLALHKALSMEPRKLCTNFALVDLLVEDGNFREAIDRLRALGERHPQEEVFTKLASVYSSNKQYAEALTYFHQALQLNPGSADALQGLERLEKLMRGEDPDELSNSMEQLDPEEQDGSMEASEYLSS
ncbi:putative tetratricopeptide-like helical domain superfamily, acetyltransferase A, auxiliary subunit [Plasmopara halstedii]